eukprot:1211555-Amphidinium_carterae.5
MWGFFARNHLLLQHPLMLIELVVVVVVPNSPPREGAAVSPRPKKWDGRPGVGGAAAARVKL